MPYVPGSSIKGAIRSGLLWFTICKDDEKINKLIGSLKADLKYNRGDLRKTIGRRFVEDFFRVNGTDKKYDAKYDLLKFLQVSDFMPTNHTLAVENVKTFSLKREGSFDNWTIIRIRGKNKKINLNQYVETVTGTFEGTINLSPQIKIALKNEKEYPLLEQKLNILGLNNSLNEKDLTNHLKKVLHEFNDWCLAQEIKLCEKANNSNLFLKELNELRSQNKENTIMRAGFGVGTVYQTLIKVIENKDRKNILRQKYKPN